ncbi:MAG TPA: hypothetical protein VI522_04165, partial [Gammaproteobacteria bacterium]|nr:hypothetical protein [Gammaproteobacteria bacterium]
MMLQQIWTTCREFITNIRPHPNRVTQMYTPTSTSTNLESIKMQFSHAHQLQRFESGSGSGTSTPLTESQFIPSLHPPRTALPVPQTQSPQPTLTRRAITTLQSGVFTLASTVLGFFLPHNFVSALTQIGITYNGLNDIKSREANRYLEGCAKQLNQDVLRLITYKHVLTPNQSTTDQDADMAQDLQNLIKEVYDGLDAIKQIVRFNTIKQYVDVTLITGYLLRFSLYKAEVNPDSEAYPNIDIVILTCTLLSGAIGFYLESKTDN